ncbi:MAG: TadE/TadG family type IV pilus assembly protein [Pseudomonadota bacterium]
MMTLLGHILSRFRRGERGATAVEFAILMPVMLVVFGAIVEGARIYWNYQAAVSGVRDATRYLARVRPADSCVGRTPVVSLPGHPLTGNLIARQRIEAHMGTGNLNLFPVGVSIAWTQTTLPDGTVVPGLTTQLLCIPTPGHTQELTPVVYVRASVVIELPFGEVFEFFGNRGNAQTVALITDQARIYGV